MNTGFVLRTTVLLLCCVVFDYGLSAQIIVQQKAQTSNPPSTNSKNGPIIVWQTTPDDVTEGGCILGAGSGDMEGSLFTSSGNQLVDRSFVVEASNLERMLDVHAPLYFLGGNVKNAFAEPGGSPGSNGRVIFSMALLNDEFNRTGAWQNFTVIVILAHEFGHIYQFKYGTKKLPVKLTELQADYFAGWYMGRREQTSNFKISAFRQAVQTMYEKGDYDFDNPQHHGTPQERMRAINEGLQHATLSASAAYKDSLRFVSGMGE
jgi:hypothetical protein